MDFWDQQALIESSSPQRNIVYSIDKIQHRISSYVYTISSKEKAPIKYTKPSAIEIFKQLTANKSSNPKLFSIEEISEKLTNTAEINLYRRISDFIRDFNNHNTYLYIQGSDGDYTIKANNEFYKLFSQSIKNESSIDFFEEEAIRLNESATQKLIKFIKNKFNLTSAEEQIKEWENWYSNSENKKRFRNFIRSSSTLKKLFKLINDINKYKTAFEFNSIDDFAVVHGYACTVLMQMPYDNEAANRIKQFIDDNDISAKNIKTNHFKITTYSGNDENGEKQFIVYMEIDYKHI